MSTYFGTMICRGSGLRPQRGHGIVLRSRTSGGRDEPGHALVRIEGSRLSARDGAARQSTCTSRNRRTRGNGDSPMSTQRSMVIKTWTPEPTRTGLAADTLQRAVLDNLAYLQVRLPELAKPY